METPSEVLEATEAYDPVHHTQQAVKQTSIDDRPSKGGKKEGEQVGVALVLTCLAAVVPSFQPVP